MGCMLAEVCSSRDRKGRLLRSRYCSLLVALLVGLLVALLR